MMNRILQGWHFMRILRLAGGIIIVWQAIMAGEWAPGLAGGVLSFLALANIGCCGRDGCSVPGRSTTTTGKTAGESKGIVFEEIKNDSSLKPLHHE